MLSLIIILFFFYFDHVAAIKKFKYISLFKINLFLIEHSYNYCHA